MARLIINGDKFYAGDDDRSGMPVRAVEPALPARPRPLLHVQGRLPHRPGHHGRFDVEEIYITWSGLIPSLSFTVGRFRQNFGVLNRWHEHDLDQVSYPSALELVLGEEGLAQQRRLDQVVHAPADGPTPTS